jgi:TetR/AcrR family transcriptional regulator, transcriptional repressor for nem operon
MPRVSREQSEKHREEIEAVSARLFRERGLNGISVVELMASVGLTHGGFYCHFESKDALAAVACTRSFDQSAARWSDLIATNDDPHVVVTTIIERYLRDANRMGAGPDCAAAALAGDIAREPLDKPVRQSFAAGLEKLFMALSEQLADREVPRQQAIVLFSTLVGALNLARATSGTPLSKEIQDAVKLQLLAQFGEPASRDVPASAPRKRNALAKTPRSPS